MKLDEVMLTINAIERGWFAETGAHSAQHQNTATGIAGDLGILRAFIVFDVPSFTAPVETMTLRLELEAYLSGEASETFVVCAVNTPPRAMSMTYRPGAAAGQAIFDDIGKGSEYGRATVTADDVGHILEIQLSQEAMHDLKAAAGNLFAIGLLLDKTEPPQADSDMLKMVRFSAASEDRTHQLVITTAQAAVPSADEPAGEAPATSSEFGLTYELPGEDISDTLRQVVSTQATTLEAMLQSVLDAVVQVQEQDKSKESGRKSSLCDLIERTCEQLSHFAENHVKVEKRIGEALLGTNHSADLSQNCLTLLNDLEEVNTVLHGNIAVARRYLELMREEHMPTNEDESSFDLDDFELD